MCIFFHLFLFLFSRKFLFKTFISFIFVSLSQTHTHSKCIHIFHFQHRAHNFDFIYDFPHSFVCVLTEAKSLMLKNNRFKGIIHWIERFGGFVVDGIGYYCNGVVKVVMAVLPLYFVCVVYRTISTIRQVLFRMYFNRNSFIAIQI